MNDQVGYIMREEANQLPYEAERARILKLTRDSYETGITEGRDRERCDSGRRRPPPEAFAPVIKPRYTEPMPTDEWLNAHKLLAFYVTNKEAEEFRAKCKEAGIRQSDALREVLTATLEGGRHKRY